MRFVCSLGRAAPSMAVMLAATPARVTLTDAEDRSAYPQLGDLADRLKAETGRAIDAAGQPAADAPEGSQQAIAEAQHDLALHLQTFGKILNEQKARLATIGDDAAAYFEALRQAADPGPEQPEIPV